MSLWSSFNSLRSLPGGVSLTAPITRCEGTSSPNPSSSYEPPPSMPKVESFDQKVWRKFSSQPLVPIGCIATAYFLASGIKSFSNRDPVRSQKMMKARVMAQFVTLVCFIGYMGLEKADWRIAPMFQDVKKAQQEQQEGQEGSQPEGQQGQQ